MDTALLWQLLPYALTAVVFIGHARGYSLPILSNLLDVLTGKQPTPAPAPTPTPVDPNQHPVLAEILKTLLDELKKRLPHPSDTAQPTAAVTQLADGTHQVTVSLPSLVTK